ncbi:LAMI_0D07448g1_1 [Lachancea mirantina]|uniref:Cytochrome c oxidase subunit 4, mitochondrial n=1 Tax=Lachancea mirantina TaxID=1230905 RepID=A0A1G4JCB8_9SACH|nr:LAMI_0D07448g1_1 [Lachancea mirantina]
MMSLRQTLRFVAPARRAFTTSRIALQKQQLVKTAASLAEVDGASSLIGPGAKQGEVPTDLEQETGLARLELLGKLEGIDVFDTKPLDSSRKGTMENPIIVETYDDYRYVGCTGSPADSHTTMWLKPTVGKVARCWECGSVYKVNAVGVPSDDNHH